MTAPERIGQLVEIFANSLDTYKKGAYNETQGRSGRMIERSFYSYTRPSFSRVVTISCADLPRFMV